MCDAICRNTNLPCTNRHRWVIPNSMCGHPFMDKDYFYVAGRSVRLCEGHAISWFARCKRRLTLKLIDGGYLSAFNKYKYGSAVLRNGDGIYNKTPRLAPKWVGISAVKGRPPEGLIEQLKQLERRT